MITPPFECEQNENQVIVHIRVPNVKMSQMEYSIVDNVFRFYVRPYFLRLTFSHPLAEDDASSHMQYDIDSDTVHVYLTKREPGAFFENLGMLTLLLSNASKAEQEMLLRRSRDRGSNGENRVDVIKRADGDNTDVEHRHGVVGGLKPFPVNEELGIHQRPLIEVIGSSDRNTEDNVHTSGDVQIVEGDQELASRVRRELEEARRNRKEFDFEWEQSVPAEDIRGNQLLLEVEENMRNDPDEEERDIRIASDAHQQYYGFDSKHSGVFKHFGEDFIGEIIDLTQPETLPKEQRSMLRMQHEDESFSADHYVADFIQNNDIRSIIAFRPRYVKEYNRTKKKIDSGDPRPYQGVVRWTETEQSGLRNLPKKEYLIDDEKRVYLTLVNILLAYAYNHRTTLGENTVESCWTVAKLSSSLAWLEEFDSLSACILVFLRRAVSYPLYRNLDLAYTCIRDVATILRAGKEVTLRCLLETKYLLDHAPDQKYLLSKIFLDDYCIWIQREADEKLAQLGNEIESCLNNNPLLKRENLPRIGGYPLIGLEQMALDYQKVLEQEGQGEEEEEEGPLPII